MYYFRALIADLLFHQMTCLFWFESIDHLKKAETIRSRPNMLTTRLAQLAKPNEQFRKWVYNVLSTTQVTQNVILLALLFIYRLKLSTPQIKGREGSEYRLLTVALMLGNKCMVSLFSMSLSVLPGGHDAVSKANS